MIPPSKPKRLPVIACYVGIAAAFVLLLLGLASLLPKQQSAEEVSAAQVRTMQAYVGGADDAFFKRFGAPHEISQYTKREEPFTVWKYPAPDGEIHVTVNSRLEQVVSVQALKWDAIDHNGKHTADPPRGEKDDVNLPGGWKITDPDGP